MLTANLPPSVTIKGFSSATGDCQQIGNTLICSLATLTSRASAAVRVVVTPSTIGTITTSATVIASETDPNPSDNSKALNVTISPAADLSVTLQDTPDPVLTGQLLTYTAVVTNNGPTNASNARLTDTLPAGLTFQSGSITGPSGTQIGTVTANGQNVLATIGALNVGQSATIRLIVAPSGTGKVTNTVTVASNEVDTKLTDNTATATTLVNPADIAVTIRTSAQSVDIGQPLTYTVTMKNNGPATATNSRMADILPAGLTPQNIRLSQGTLLPSPTDRILVQFGDLGVGQSATLTFTVVPDTSRALVNSAGGLAVPDDPNPANDFTTVVNTVNPIDLGVGIVAPTGPLTVGDQITYIVYVANGGPSKATGVTFRDALPSNLRFISATPIKGVSVVGLVGNEVVAHVNDLVHKDFASLTITAEVIGEGTIVNTGRVVGVGYDLFAGNNATTVRTTVVNPPGKVEYAQPSFTVNENSGQATITLRRIGGTKGQVAVNYAAVPGTAINGTDFVQTGGVMVFQDGETTKTFTVPILDDTAFDGTKTVQLLLSIAKSTTQLGTQSSAVLNILDNDVDVYAPQVSNLQLLGSAAITGMQLTFTEPLDPARALNPANYQLFASATAGHFGRPGGVIPISGVSYVPGSQVVILTPSQPLAPGPFYQLQINGTTAGGVTDRFGNLLDGDYYGGSGGNYLNSFARGSSLTYNDGNGDLVSLRLANGGLLELTRWPNGEGKDLSAIGITPGRSVLTGSVRRVVGGDGVTTLRSISGLGPFGAVQSRLTTPPFYVLGQVRAASTVTAQGSADRVPAGPLSRRRMV